MSPRPDERLNSYYYGLLREGDPSAPVRQQVDVYWHRENAQEPWRVWFVSTTSGKLLWGQNTTFRPLYLPGDICQPPVGGPKYRVRKARIVPTEMSNPNAPKPKPSRFASIRFQTHGERIAELTAELEAADEIEEALTMRIEELRAELEQKRWGIERLQRDIGINLRLYAGIATEATAEHNRARAECATLKRERDEARGLVLELAAAVPAVAALYRASRRLEFNEALIGLVKSAERALKEISQ